MKFYTIYKTVNTVTDYEYIGMHVTSDPYDNYLGSGKRLRLAIKKHGIDKFYKVVLFIFDRMEDMLRKEAEIVNEHYLKTTKTYNLCLGGKGGFYHINENKLNSRKGSKLSDDNKRKMLVARLAKPTSDETRKRQSANNGMKRPEVKAKFAASVKSKPKTEQHKFKIAEGVRRHNEAKKLRS